MLLYKKKLIALEEEYAEVSRFINELGRAISDLPAEDGENEKTKIKFQLSLAAERIRLIKEQTAFYMKMGENYDLTRLLEDIQDAILNHDAELEKRILICICEKWEKMSDGDDRGKGLAGRDIEPDSQASC